MKKLRNIVEAKKSQWAHPDIDFKKVKAKENSDPMEKVHEKHPKAGHALRHKASEGVWEVHHKDHGHVGYMGASESHSNVMSGRIKIGHTTKKKYEAVDLEGQSVGYGHSWNKDDVSQDFGSHMKKKHETSQNNP
jgi:hypothetical protein